MLMLLMHVGEARYALACESIVEIVPHVTLNPIPDSTDHVAGLFNYRGTPVVVIDLCRLVAQRPSSGKMHSRVVLVKDAKTKRVMGILAEHITRTIVCDVTKFQQTDAGPTHTPYLGGVMTDGTVITRQLLIEPLFELLAPVAS